MKRGVLLFSGGVDSTLALHWSLKQLREVHVLEVDFPDRPRGEINAATKVLKRLRPSSRTRVIVPFLRAAQRGPAGYLPTRNLLYHSIAQSLAETIDADVVVAGHIREDAEGFPDAEPNYFAELEGLAMRGRPRAKRIRIENPLQKAGIEELARTIPIPLSWTWSCWNDRSKPCGRCEKCVRRDDLLRRLNPPTRTPWASKTPTGNRARQGSRASRR